MLRMWLCPHWWENEAEPELADAGGSGVMPLESPTGIEEFTSPLLTLLFRVLLPQSSLCSNWMLEFPEWGNWCLDKTTSLTSQGWTSLTQHWNHILRTRGATRLSMTSCCSWSQSVSSLFRPPAGDWADLWLLWTDWLQPCLWKCFTSERCGLEKTPMRGESRDPAPPPPPGPPGGWRWPGHLPHLRQLSTKTGLVPALWATGIADLERGRGLGSYTRMSQMDQL